MIKLKNPFGVVQDFLAVCFYRYGLFLSRHPKIFSIAPLILTCILGLGVFNIRVEDDLRFLYSPTHSLSRFEYKIHQEFSGDSTNASYLSVTVEWRDRSSPNLLVPERAKMITDLNRYVLRNMTIDIGEETVNFGDKVCPGLPNCPLSNTIVEIFFDTFWSKKLREDPRIKIEYPTMNFFDNKFFLLTHLYGVTPGGPLGLQHIDMVHLIYMIPSYKEFTSEEVSKAFESRLKEVLEGKSELQTTMFSLSILKDEMQKNATYTIPFISLTILLLMSFTVGSCMTGDWITSKPIEAMMGIFTSTLAIISAGGLLFGLGIPFVHQVTVMPFIALAIGVDDTYVMLGAWQDTKRTLSPERRMALALEEAGTAISVTSITSILSFGIGTMSSTPAIAIFCKFIAIAVVFDWTYQLTFFAAVMALGARREAAGYHCVMVWKKMPQKDIDQSKCPDAISPTRRFFEDKFAPFICHPATRIVMIFVYGAYIFTAFYGCSLLEPNLTPSRLVVDDSPLIHYLHLAQDKIWAEGLIGRVYVNNAPDFTKHPEQIARMKQFVSELESTPYSMGPNSTSFWLNEYDEYRQFFAGDDSTFYRTLDSFLAVSFNNHWNTTMQWAPQEGVVDRHGQITIKQGKYVKKFFFTTAFKIKNWDVRTSLLLQWRNITSKYRDFEALVFDENNFYSDQMLELKTTTLQSLGTAILTLITVCILFVAESQIVFWVVFTLISMDIGTAGFLSLWGADLDPTTVVNILMSIGQCIDFATHVGYRIYRSEFSNPDDRIKDALGAMGWPVMQGGLSSLLAIAVMIVVPSNAVRMFARTSVLVVATGLFHGLFILPIVIRTFASNAKAHMPMEHIKDH
ncbi:ptr-15 [Pristionchus pacificus]|uniref:Ptr-15 n=1 Tax=Pristionchus pacificus TaxID=54126 RepID=A0A2A6C8H2_PRIPA|nr:ptr-15 [Pristionchus pacificus]|eukprot:PDM74459.1 ptr-15 [Pristionchus pacificus]